MRFLNKPRSTFRVPRFAVLALAIGCLPLAIPPKAAAQVSPVRIRSFLTNTVTFTNMGTSNMFNLSAPIELSRDRGLRVQLQFNGDGALVTTQSCLTFVTSADGTNYGQNVQNLLNFYFTPLTAVANYPETNFPAQLLNNARYIKVFNYTNNNNATAMVSRITNVLAVVNN